MSDDVAIFESHRTALRALAYRMLGDVGRAEDAVQEAWLRWSGREVEVANPKAYLVTVVTRLCLNELDSARARHEESRSDRLPEPIDLKRHGFDAVELGDEVSMAFLVILQRLTPPERAVLLLHDVFDFSHAEIADLVSKSEPACRQLLRRAHESIAGEKRAVEAPAGEHRRLLRAFVDAAQAGDVTALTNLLARDAVVISDGGADGVRVGGVRNLPRPLSGVAKIAAFLSSATQHSGGFDIRECELNGRPAILASQNGKTIAAILLSVADGKIRNVFIHADPAHLGHVGAERPAAEHAL